MINGVDYRLLNALISDGHTQPFCTSNKQLSARLNYSIRAVMNRVERLKKIAGVRNRAALAVWWMGQRDAEVECWRCGVVWQPGEKRQRAIDSNRKL